MTPEPCDLDAIRRDARIGLTSHAVPVLCDELEATRVEVVRLQTELAGWQMRAKVGLDHRDQAERERDEWMRRAHLLIGERVQAERERDEARAALRHIADTSDDYGTCPYFTKHDEGGDPEGTCDRGCRDEPECQTCRPEDGWPSERARLVLARVADTHPPQTDRVGWQDPEDFCDADD